MRKSIFRSNKKFFHVSLSFNINIRLREAYWLYLQKKIRECLQPPDQEIHALVMMDTHVHLLIAVYDNSENFFSESLQKILCPDADLTQLSEPILNYSQYLNTYKYIYRNPMEAGLSARVEDYPYSSLFYLLGKGLMSCEVTDQLGLIQDPVRLLNWLNNSGNYKASKLQWLAKTIEHG